MQVRRFGTVLFTMFLFTLVPEFAEARRGDCEGFRAALTAFHRELARSGSNPAAARDLLAKVKEEESRCVDDRDSDQIEDDIERKLTLANDLLGELDDDGIDWDAARAGQRRAANAVGWPVRGVEFRVTRDKLDDGSATTDASRRWARSVGCADDDAGHIRANQLGGKGGKGSKNIFPQNLSINRGRFRDYEHDVREWFDRCHLANNEPLAAKVSFTFGDDKFPYRPTHVHYRINGLDPGSDCRRRMTKSWSFENPRGPGCIARR